MFKLRKTRVFRKEETKALSAIHTSQGSEEIKENIEDVALIFETNENTFFSVLFSLLLTDVPSQQRRWKMKE